MALISREQLNAVKLRTRLVQVPEWRVPGMDDGEVPEVLVRELTGAERDEYEASLVVVRGIGKKTTQELNLQNSRARLAVKTMINPDGSRMFNDTAADIAFVGKLPSRGLERIVDAVMELSGINQTEEAEKEAISAGVENFTKTETNGFGLNSH